MAYRHPLKGTANSIGGNNAIEKSRSCITCQLLQYIQRNDMPMGLRMKCGNKTFKFSRNGGLVSHQKTPACRFNFDLLHEYLDRYPYWNKKLFDRTSVEHEHITLDSNREKLWLSESQLITYRNQLPMMEGYNQEYFKITVDELWNDRYNRLDKCISVLTEVMLDYHYVEVPPLEPEPVPEPEPEPEPVLERVAEYVEPEPEPEPLFGKINVVEIYSVGIRCEGNDHQRALFKHMKKLCKLTKLLVKMLDTNFESKIQSRKYLNNFKHNFDTKPLPELDMSCVACSIKIKNSVAAACGHVSVCFDCSAKCKSKCPICRTKTKFIKLYV